MAVIVYNKNTGKYLKKHSGSYNHFRSSITYSSKFRKEITEKFGEGAMQWGNPTRKENKEKIDKIMEEYMFNASPEEAHVYHSANSVIHSSSIGIYTESWGTTGRKKSLPEHLEIHEIKESFVCIIRPDGGSNCDEERESNGK